MLRGTQLLQVCIPHLAMLLILLKRSIQAPCLCLDKPVDGLCMGPVRLQLLLLSLLQCCIQSLHNRHTIVTVSLCSDTTHKSAHARWS